MEIMANHKVQSRGTSFIGERRNLREVVLNKPSLEIEQEFGSAGSHWLMFGAFPLAGLLPG